MDTDSIDNGTAVEGSSTGSLQAELISPIGYILAASYPILALSTGARAMFRLVEILFFGGTADILPPTLSAIAALLYIIATIGFAYRKRWSWWLSISSLGIESLLTLIIGTLSYTAPDLVGNTVWRHFGEDYAYFPLFQPILGLIWLYWPGTQSQYGFSSQRDAPGNRQT